MLASVLANAFPLRREGGVRHSLELLGARLDRGFNILLYPEGKLTVGGPMQPFKPGVGLIAIEGADADRPDEDPHPSDVPPRRGAARPGAATSRSCSARPIRFDADADPTHATTLLEEAVRAL